MAVRRVMSSTQIYNISVVLVIGHVEVIQPMDELYTCGSDTLAMLRYCAIILCNDTILHGTTRLTILKLVGRMI